MRKSRFTESQIVQALKQVEGGRKLKDVCREIGVSEATYYQWNSKYGGMEAADVRRPTAEGAEGREQPAQADLCRAGPGKHGPEGRHHKKALSPDEKRCVVTALTQEHGLSQRRACQAAGVARSVVRYRKQPDWDDAVIALLQERVERYPKRGFGKLFKLTRRRCLPWNHKRVWRVYCALKLNLRRKGKRRLPPREPRPLASTEAPNACWSAEFMSDVLWDGRRFRTFNVVDDFNREALAVEIDLNLPVPRVIRVLERIAAWRGYPQQLRLDNGPEFVSAAIAGSYRHGVLDHSVFRTLIEVRKHTEQRLQHYNETIPHEWLGGLTPVEYRKLHHPDTSGCAWTQSGEVDRHT